MRYITRKNQPSQPLPDEQILGQKLDSNLQVNMEYLEQLLDGCSDAVIRKFKFGKGRDIDAALLYFDGLLLKTEAEDSILRPLMLEFDLMENTPETKAADMYENVKERLLVVTDLLECDTFDKAVQHLASGDAILLINGYDRALVAGIRSW